MKTSDREKSSNISYIYYIVLGMSSETSSKMSLSNTNIYFLLVTTYRFHKLKVLIFRTQVDNFLRRNVPIHISFPPPLYISPHSHPQSSIDYVLQYPNPSPSSSRTLVHRLSIHTPPFSTTHVQYINLRYRTRIDNKQHSAI